GQDRMIVGRGRNLDLAARGEVAVDRQNRGQGVPLLADHALLIVQRIVPAFADQLPQLFVRGQQIFIEPGDLAQDLQIPQILRRQGLTPPLKQLQITRIAADDPVQVRLEEIPLYESSLRFRQILRGYGGALKERIGGSDGSA